MTVKYLFTRYLPLALCSALVLSSCATTRSKPRPTKKRVKRVKKPVRTKPAVAKPIKPAPRIVKRETLNQLYTRYLDETQALSERDRQLVERFTTKDNPSHLEQAAAFVGHLRLVQMQADRSSDFVEQGLPSSAASGSGLPVTDRSQLPKNISLADYFSRRGIDPIEQLRSNPSLNRPAVYQLLAKVMAKTNNHDSFVTAARNTFQEAFGQWKALAPSYGMITDKNEALAGEETDAVDESSAEEAYHIPSGTSFADFRHAEAQLVEGQMLANNNDYQNAIRYLATIPDAHPFYPIASEKKRFFTNYAVQQLREQASDSYRQALPVADLATKKGLLVKAKNTLVMAIKRYPNAEHIDTVRENLEVIERDLKKIQIEQSDANY